MSAAGQVTTGFSLPYVAVYSATGSTVTYTNGQKLARGVDVTINPESSSDNDFHADNVVAETAGGKFTGGTVDLTVDGLFNATKRVIWGLPAADTNGWTAYGDGMEIPYVGIGFIARHQSEGVVSYCPIVLAKCKFALESESAATQGEEIDWQTRSLSASLYRSDDADHNWKFEGNEYESESAAEAALKTKLGISA